MKKKFVNRFSFEYNNEIYTAIYERGFAPMWSIYKGTRKIESRWITGYDGWGATALPSQVKERFIQDMKNKTR